MNFKNNDGTIPLSFDEKALVSSVLDPDRVDVCTLAA
jgi:hypothetical protein